MIVYLMLVCAPGGNAHNYFFLTKQQYTQSKSGDKDLTKEIAIIARLGRKYDLSEINFTVRHRD